MYSLGNSWVLTQGPRLRDKPPDSLNIASHHVRGKESMISHSPALNASSSESFFPKGACVSSAYMSLAKSN